MIFHIRGGSGPRTHLVTARETRFNGSGAKCAIFCSQKGIIAVESAPSPYLSAVACLGDCGVTEPELDVELSW